MSGPDAESWLQPFTLAERRVSWFRASLARKESLRLGEQNGRAKTARSGFRFLFPAAAPDAGPESIHGRFR